MTNNLNSGTVSADSLCFYANALLLNYTLMSLVQDLLRFLDHVLKLSKLFLKFCFAEENIFCNSRTLKNP